MYLLKCKTPTFFENSITLRTTKLSGMSLITKMEVSLIDTMGSDLTVSNAARVSFGKRKLIMDKTDEKLISYLAKHNHWTPFEQ